MRRVLEGFAVAWLVLSTGCVFGQDVSWQDIGGGLTGVGAVAASEEKGSLVVIAGGRQGIFLRDGGTMQWRLVMPLSGTDITAIRVDSRDHRCIYAATGSGVYRSLDRGKNWRKLFSGKNAQESSCRDIAVLPYGLYLATGAGIFVSHDEGRSFDRITSGAPLRDISEFAFSEKNPEVLYVVSVDGVYRCLNAGAWEQIKVLRPSESVGATDAAVDSDDTEGKSIVLPGIRAVTCDRKDSSVVYTAAAVGAMVSRDKGASWEVLTSSGLTGGRITKLYTAQDSTLFALCEKGVFAFRDGVWKDISNGLSGSSPRVMAENTFGGLYLATDKGIYAYQSDTVTIGRQAVNSVDNEPTIRQVQDAAVSYAECEPEKIARWRAQAAGRAWLPKVSTGINRDSGDLWHWEGGSTTKEEDDVLRKGRDNLDWSVSLSWDLSELIWNGDQTSIDSRSRLTVELRNSVLDEVTKLYFERKRLRHDVESLPVDDAKQRFDKELKIQELAASLDALTGGYFSK